MEKIEDQIEKKQLKIEKLNELAFKTSIKTQMLGKDVDRNEYWFFKEEPGKIFVKKFEQVKQEYQMDVDEANDILEPTEPRFEWRYFDEEDEFEKLIEACN